MKICPMYEMDCPYFKVVANTVNGMGTAIGCCSLEHPEEDCDDYASMIEE